MATKTPAVFSSIAPCNQYTGKPPNVVKLPVWAVRRPKSFSDAKAFQADLKSRPKRFVGVAEGDSWFDYLPAYLDTDLPNGDLLGELNEHPDLHIFKVAKAGDTLENMAYGPRGTGGQLKETIKAFNNVTTTTGTAEVVDAAKLRGWLSIKDLSPASITVNNDQSRDAKITSPDTVGLVAHCVPLIAHTSGPNKGEIFPDTSVVLEVANQR